jgi:hypothetical protein
MILIFSIAVFGSNAVGSHENQRGGSKMSETIKADTMGIRLLEIQNSVGEVELKPSVDNEMKMKVNKIVKNATQKVSQNILNRTKILLERHNNKISIKAVDRNNENIEINEFVSRNYKQKIDMEIDYILEVPASIDEFFIHVNTGKIVVDEKRSGSFDLGVDVGSIIADKIKTVGKSNFNVGVGKITTGFWDVEKAEKINLKTETGDIELVISKSAKCTVEMEQFMEADQKSSFNGGGIPIKAVATMGDVKIRFY